MNKAWLGIFVFLTFILSACTGSSGDGAASTSTDSQVQSQQSAESENENAEANQDAVGGHYTGTIKSGQNFKLTLSEDGRQVTEISADVLEYCGGSTTSSWTTLYLAGPFEVKEDGTVSVEGEEKHGDLSLTYKFTARFDSQGKASGTIDQSTVVVGSVCRTYKLEWEAQKK